MSETKFTKGGWRSSGRLVYCGEKFIATSSITDTEYTESESNAKLIAAAPNMYALLDEISDGLLEVGGFGNCELAKRIEALLEKARGEA